MNMTCRRMQRIGGRLGNGSFGTVAEAFNDQTNERVAVKQMPLAAEDPRKQEQIKVRRTLAKRQASRTTATHGCAYNARWLP
jgi:hypothetical protein